MADPEIPEAAVTAAAEVLFERWRTGFAKDLPLDSFGMGAHTFVPEAREVLAAALPHLGVIQIEHPWPHVTCPVCGRRVGRLPDGLVATHTAPAERCPGSRTTKIVTEE